MTNDRTVYILRTDCVDAYNIVTYLASNKLFFSWHFLKVWLRSATIWSPHFLGGSSFQVWLRSATIWTPHFLRGSSYVITASSRYPGNILSYIWKGVEHVLLLCKLKTESYPDCFLAKATPVTISLLLFILDFCSILRAHVLTHIDKVKAWYINYLKLSQTSKHLGKGKTLLKIESNIIEKAKLCLTWRNLLHRPMRSGCISFISFS